jgi:hypothetical protein
VRAEQKQRYRPKRKGPKGGAGEKSLSLTREKAKTKLQRKKKGCTRSKTKASKEEKGWQEEKKARAKRPGL